MVPKKKGGKTKLGCGKCSFISQKRESLVLKESVNVGRNVEVVDKKVDILPKTQEMCPKCGHKEAYYWSVQTRAADEAETRFFKCVKCNHTWRSYD